MARILICHVPKDGSTARDIGAMLMGRSHFVSFDGEPDTARADRFSRLRQFEAVLVVWTEHSMQSAGLVEIARETLPLNLLVPLRAETVPATSLPLMFRKLNMLSPRDFEAIARFVARLSTAASSLKEMAARDALMREAEATDDASDWSQDPRSRERTAAPEPAPAPPDKWATGHSSGGLWWPSAFTTKPRQDADGSDRSRPAAKDTAPPGRAQLARPLALPEVAPPPMADAPPEAASLAPKPAPKARPPLPPFVRQETPAAPVASADDLARLIDAGLITIRIPKAMWHGEPQTVEVLLDRRVLAAKEAGSDARPGSQATERGQVGQIETLSIGLYASTDAVTIVRQSERTQFVKRTPDGRDPNSNGLWVWLLTPGQPGDHDLVLRISGLLRDRHGVPTPVALPDRHHKITVHLRDGVGQTTHAGWHRR